MAKLKGIDVSEHNGKINWKKVKASGVDFAIIRVGFGTNLKKQDDKQFKTNIEECKKNGIPFGVYLFSYANSVEKAKSEAEHVLRLVKGLKLDLPVFYDLEDENTTGKCSNSTILAISKAFEKIIANSGYSVGFYANKYWWSNKLNNAYYDKFMRWVAQYANACTYKGKVDMWQYSEKGKVDGITGTVDMNYKYSEISKKKAYTGALPSTNLKKGSKGEEVKKLQKFLNWALNVKLDVDGDYGIKTENAVKEFQKKMSITVDGKFGPLTLSAAKKYKI